ncbi:hypothetical protein VCUG_01891, partial [Vavraia culicis subsp. floridensis]
MNTLIMKNHPIDHSPVTAICTNNRQIFVFQSNILTVYSSLALTKTFICDVKICVTACCVYNDVLYMGTDDGLYTFAKNQLAKVRECLVVRICVVDRRLYIVERKDNEYVLVVDGEDVCRSRTDIFVGWAGNRLVVVGDMVRWGLEEWEWVGDGLTSFHVVSRISGSDRKEHRKNKKRAKKGSRKKNEHDLADKGCAKTDISDVKSYHKHGLVDNEDIRTEFNDEMGSNWGGPVEESENQLKRIQRDFQHDIISGDEGVKDNIKHCRKYYGVVTTEKGDLLLFELKNGLILQKLKLRNSSVYAVKLKEDFIATGNDSRIMWIKSNEEYFYQKYRQLDIHYSKTHLVIDNGRIISAGEDSLLNVVYTDKEMYYKYFNDNTGVLKTYKNILCVLENKTLNFYTLNRARTGEDAGECGKNSMIDENGCRKQNKNGAGHTANTFDNGDFTGGKTGNYSDRMSKRIEYLLRYKTNQRILSYDLNDKFIAYTNADKTVLLHYVLGDRLMIDKAKEFSPCYFLKITNDQLIMVKNTIVIFDLNEFKEREVTGAIDVFNVMNYDWNG